MTPPTAVDLLGRADAARAAGRADDAARLYDEAITRCRAADDLASWTRAVLGAASVYVFGTEPGKLPAQLYDVLVRTTDDGDRARVAAALARCWAYAGQPARSVRFADEAVERAEQAGEPELLADCLDAALATHWGPDDLASRTTLAQRLDEVAAHSVDSDARLQAHLWGLQVACEALDLQRIHRHMRALEQLGEESPRALFFAASRRLMLDLLRGRTDTATHLIAVAEDASQRASLSDAWMVVEAMKGYVAMQSGDTITCAEVAAECEAFGIAEGASTVCAEAAFLWLGAEDLDRARRLVHTFYGPVLDELPRDVNWLLTLQCVLEAAIAVADRTVAETAARLLGPYSGRAVFNAGAVMFHGLVDDTLARADAILGEPETAARLRDRALASYERLGATWWRNRLETWKPPTQLKTNTRIRFHPTADGLWLVGPPDNAVTLRALRGFTYLRVLLRRPTQPVHALDVVTGGSGVVQADLGAVLDPTAVQAYRRRLRDLDQDLVEAENWSDAGRVAALQLEREALVGELSSAAGLRGRPRPSGSSTERARVAATKAINTAIVRLGTVDQPLARHLRNTIHTGVECSYQPQPDDQWKWILDA